MSKDYTDAILEFAKKQNNRKQYNKKRRQKRGNKALLDGKAYITMLNQSNDDTGQNIR
jgi:hypothetical protein